MLGLPGCRNLQSEQFRCVLRASLLKPDDVVGGWAEVHSLVPDHQHLSRLF